MSGPSRARRGLPVLVAGLVLATASGCVEVPDAGPIRSTGTVAGGVLVDGVPAIDPEPPAPGAGPGEIVRGFLDAMQASPVSTAVAQEYLTPDARAGWRPERATYVYLDRSEPVGTSDVEVRLTDADRYDQVGAWRGGLSEEESTLHFRLAYVDGEFRITDPPDALIVGRSWFDPRYAAADLYFFDPTGRMFVPEPVVAPVGESRASSLVRALLRGPSEDLRRRGVEQTFIPLGLDLALSVPVDDQGLARVTLQGDPPISEQQTALMVAQLAWTMRQDPRVLAVQVVLNGTLLRFSGGADRVEVGTGSSFDTSTADASGVLYGLLDGRLAAGPVGSLDLLDGPLSRPKRSFRSVAVDLDGASVAAVDAAGTRLVTGPTRTGTLTPVRTAVEGTDLLRPAWTADGRLWDVDRAGGRAVVYAQTAGPGGRMAAIDVPRVSGADVRRFLVSRDGTRLVALLREGGRSQVVVARVASGADGRLLRVLPAEPLREAGSARRILDVAWFGDNALAVLTRVGDDVATVDSIGIDGSPTAADALGTSVAGARSLIGSPDPGQPLYALTGDELVDLGRAGRGTRTAVGGATALGYVG